MSKRITTSEVAETCAVTEPSLSSSLSRVLTGDNPFNVVPSLDLLSEPPQDRPAWSETQFFMVWSPESEAGIWIHLGVMPGDKTLWWAQTFALLPGGQVLVDRSFGRTTDKAGPSTGNLHVRRLKPDGPWTLSFDGAGELTTTEDLSRRPAGSGVPEPFSFDIQLEPLVPVYDMHQAIAGDLDWDLGTLHHEQGMTAKGSIRALGRLFHIDGVAVRDHSAGDRDFARFGGHVWTYIVWPESRRALGIMEAWRPRTHEVFMSLAVLFEGNRVEITPEVLVTGLNQYGGIPEIIQLSFRRADGSRINLRGEAVHNVTMTYAEPNHNLNGNWSDSSLGLRDPLVADETIVRWAWTDGEIGYGHLERGFRASSLPMPVAPTAPGSTLKEQ